MVQTQHGLSPRRSTTNRTNDTNQIPDDGHHPIFNPFSEFDFCIYCFHIQVQRLSLHLPDSCDSCDSWFNDVW